MGTDDRDYRVCEMCGEVMPLDDVFVYADERLLVCRTCTTAKVWSVDAGPSDYRDGGRTRF